PCLLETYHDERFAVAEKIAYISAKLTGQPQSGSVSIGGDMQRELQYVCDKHGPFFTGIGIEYPPSFLSLDDGQNPDIAIRPGARAPDGRLNPSNPLVDDGPTRLLDLFTAAPRFHILVFTGIPSRNHRALERLAELLAMPEMYLDTFRNPRVSTRELFDFALIVPAIEDPKREKCDFMDTLGVCYVDDVRGGDRDGLYARYGIDIEEGAVLIVRPDGIIGCWEALGSAFEHENYFASFLAHRDGGT
ncbi:thioredoxin-like protein, partial [Jimgerdemannia flammicorona]